MIARIGRLWRENTRSGSCAWNKFERPVFTTVAMTTRLSKSAKHPLLAGVEWGGGQNTGKLGRAARGVTMGVLSLEICKEHAGWSVHCFNSGFRWKTYHLAALSRKKSAVAKLTRRRTIGVDDEYNHFLPNILFNYLHFIKREYIAILCKTLNR